MQKLIIIAKDKVYIINSTQKLITIAKDKVYIINSIQKLTIIAKDKIYITALFFTLIKAIVYNEEHQSNCICS